MTDRRDLKRRVRERQARTGESYMTALRHVQSERPTSTQPPRAGASAPIPFIELADLTPLGASLGLKCRIAIFPAIADRVDPTAMLVRLRDALISTEGDRPLSLMRRVVLRGEGGSMRINAGTIDEARRFVNRAKAGIGGISESGRMLALPVEGSPNTSHHLLLFILQLTPDVTLVHRDPTLLITSPDGLSADPLLGWMMEAEEP